MLDRFYAFLANKTPIAVPIIAISLMLMCGFLMTRITKKLKLPNVTAYIITGILLGPSCLKCIPESVIRGSEFISDIALAFIAFSIGEFFKFSKLKQNPTKIIIISLAESLGAAVLVFVLMFVILRLPLSFSLVLSALASATAPTSTMMTIKQTKARGDFVDTLLQVIAYDDLLALIAYGIAISVAVTFENGEAFSVMAIVTPLLTNIAGLIIGGIFGLLLKLLIHQKRTTDNRLIIAVALFFGFCGISELLDVSPLLGCIAMGTVYINLSNDDTLFKQLNYFSPPILLLFFVRSGAGLRFDALFSSSVYDIGKPLLLVCLIYLVVRLVGKYFGSYLGCALTKKPKSTRNYFGLALIPQAGVAIGLATLATRSFGAGNIIGGALENVILATSIVYEIIGPPLTKVALYKSGAYSNKLEDLVPVTAVSAELPCNANTLSPLELLIARIHKIQAELAAEPVNEEEDAFTEAAQEYENAIIGIDNDYGDKKDKDNKKMEADNADKVNEAEINDITDNADKADKTDGGDDVVCECVISENTHIDDWKEETGSDNQSDCNNKADCNNINCSEKTNDSGEFFDKTNDRGDFFYKTDNGGEKIDNEKAFTSELFDKKNTFFLEKENTDNDFSDNIYVKTENSDFNEDFEKVRNHLIKIDDRNNLSKAENLKKRKSKKDNKKNKG